MDCPSAIISDLLRVKKRLPAAREKANHFLFGRKKLIISPARLDILYKFGEINN